MSIICVSGGFDPLHIGHIDYLKGAAARGRVVVILNSDAWLVRKKGYCFMPYAQRKKMLEELPYVTLVFDVDDSDGSVCEALRRIKPDFFANGGDRTEKNTLELDVCRELKIMPLFRIGGNKTASSSEMARAAHAK